MAFDLNKESAIKNQRKGGRKRDSERLREAVST